MRVCAHLFAVFYKPPSVLDNSNSNEGSDAGQEEKHHSCYPTLVAHLVFGSHFLLARNRVKEDVWFSLKASFKVKMCRCLKKS